MTSTPPDVLESAAQDIGVPALRAKLAAQDVALTRIERIAAQACGTPPASTSALEVCELLHHAAKESEELGYMPPETLGDAVRLARRARGHAARLESREEMPGRGGP